MTKNAESWKKTYYPIPASRVRKKDAIAHSLQKWRGLRLPVLNAHGLHTKRASVIDNATHTEILRVYSSSCALCIWYLNEDSAEPCTSCPLYKALGGWACDDRRGPNPYAAFWDTGDPESMIAALEKAEKMEQTSAKKKMGKR